MTPERTKELIPLFDHFAEGGAIQSHPNLKNIDLPWRDNPNPQWCDDCVYRKKPEPREIYLNFIGDSLLLHYDIENDALRKKLLEIYDNTVWNNDGWYIDDGFKDDYLRELNEVLQKANER